MGKRKWIFFAACLSGFLLLSGLSHSQSLRKPCFAGKFYPADPAALTRLIERLRNNAGTNGDKFRDKELRALIMPHAGYVYSGLTAAHATLLLDGRSYEKVVIMAPDHTTGFQDAVINTADAWETPLGVVRVHKDAQDLVKKERLFKAGKKPYLREHAVEVILPFLQHSLERFELVPVVMGNADIDRTARAIDDVIDSETLVVASSDLSHYLPYEDAVKRDQKTIDMILNREWEKLTACENCACGVAPLVVLLKTALKKGWEPFLLHYANSGDAGGSRERVVGYCSVAFFKSVKIRGGTNMDDKLTKEEGRILLDLARVTISRELDAPVDKARAEGLDERLEKAVFDEKRGVFVTLHKNGNLRGCIGSLEPSEPIREGVRENALNSAFHDPRFPPLKKGELKAVDIEISILTKPAELVYSDAADLVSKIRPGTDGLIIKKGWKRATFLPQVWEQLPEPETFLSHLCRKASLDPDQWKKGDLEVMTYQVQYFEENS